MTERIFNQIAHRYDFLNRLLSLGLDQYWRKQAISFLPKSPNLKVLDIATGTADLALMMAQRHDHIERVVGVDIAKDMLQIGRRKVKEAGLCDKIHLDTGDALKLEFPNESFDAVTVAFGLRNMPNQAEAVREMRRVVKPGGRLIILEFSMPKHPIFRLIYLAYFRHILPVVGGLLSGHYQAYRYLNQSVEQFDSSVLNKMQAYPLSLGIATLYVSDSVA
ncbi:MAG: bifunctional demethylmenaquinone methyltransferase/2-methoxy-6-polyprenyl-1,4-benzoquinol methylase UbiE [Deltaproteobacteria bacterium]|nr:bifunctional demethylmenaquinone methyltransferase/2-methoxy-6-polyprenyl-1,4-benzoquinol methylase UbiE [Deltaproteobacteria bacterium]